MIANEVKEKVIKNYENHSEKVIGLTELPMGIIAKIATFDNEIRYQALTSYGKAIGMGDLFPTFEQATLHLMYRVDRNLIEAAERVLSV